jgi:hypothetical protein
MPNRYIREAAIESEPVNSLSWKAEVFYRRLMNRVDDFGRFDANPALLRASIFPLQLKRVSDSDMPRLLAECEKAGLLYVYAAVSKSFLVLNKWEPGRAKHSYYPEPPANVLKKMSEFVYIGKHRSADVPDPDTDSDTDSDPYAALPLGLVTDGFKSAWDDYLKHRKEIRARPLKPRSIASQWKEMDGWGEPAAVEAIRKTIRQGWQGVFAPDGKGKPNGTNTHQRPNDRHYQQQNDYSQV